MKSQQSGDNLKNKSRMNRSMEIGDTERTPKHIDSSLLKPSPYALKDL